jgi:hypothetical protein
MRIAARMALAAVLTVALVASADAQNRQRGQGQRQGQGRQGFGGGMFGGGFSAFSMLANNKVLQEELKVTDEQKDKLKEALKPIQEKQRELRGIFTPGEQPTEEQLKEFREKSEKIAADTKKAVEGVLKPEQAKRLTQINHQVMGVRAFTDKEVQAELKLTDEQKEKIKGIAEEYAKDSQEIRRSGPRFQFGQPPSDEDRKKMEENQKKIAALTKETEEKIAEKLTDDQKKAWKEMIGEKIDVAKVMAANQFQRPRRDN